MNVLDELTKELRFTPKNLTVEYGGEGYTAQYADGKSKIRCQNNVQLAKALVELKRRGTRQAFVAEGRPVFEDFGVMFDTSRNAVPTVETVKKLIRLSALMGYNLVMLYMEDTYTIDERPYFGYLRGRYSKQELQELDEYAAAFDVELVPFIQTLAHLMTVKKWWALGDMFDVNDILLCDDEKTYVFIEDMFRALRGCFKTDRVNIGMDEADMVGLGKYLKQYGYVDKFELLLRHLTRVCEIARKYGFKPMMWSDMFFRIANDGQYYGHNPVPQSVAQRVPDNVSLVYWDYRPIDTAHYDRMLKAHRVFDREIWFANSAWKCIGFMPHNLFTFRTSDASFPAMFDNGIKHFFTTCWGDNGGECSVFSVLPALCYMGVKSDLHPEDDAEDERERFISVFEALTDIAAGDYLLLDSPNQMGGKTLTNQCPSKYFLYNDLFSGYLDSRYEASYKTDMAEIARKLQTVRNKGLAFETAYRLARALEIRLGLGVETREAYRKGDKNKLRQLAEGDYAQLLERLEAFYAAYKKQWFAENKPQGFEVQDIRLGGLLQRVKTCRERLLQHAETGAPLAELEDEILFFHWGDDASDRHIDIYNWSNYVTVNTI